MENDSSVAPVEGLWRQVLGRLMFILPNPQSLDWQTCYAAQWRELRWHGQFVAHMDVANADTRPGVGLDDLLNIDDQKAQLVQNTDQFLRGLPANNVLLWGSRGTGKSSLIHALLNHFGPHGLRLVEINREDLNRLAMVVEQLRTLPFKFVVFCDDLSFEVEDPSYKELKSALEGSIFKTADNVLIYATSNRRHLVPEHMSDNQQSHLVDGELHHGEAVEEKISLSDRFGIWLSFYPFRQEAYLQVVNHWVKRLADQYNVSLSVDGDDVESQEMRRVALQWALARGARNGRTAQYFARHWVGSKGVKQDV